MTPEQIATAIAECDVGVTFTTHPARLYALIGLVQVALRHPDVPEAPAQIGLEFIGNMGYALAETVGIPEIEALVELGNDEQYDLTHQEMDDLYSKDLSEVLAYMVSSDRPHDDPSE